jgi:hypothetical protein
MNFFPKYRFPINVAVCIFLFAVMRETGTAAGDTQSGVALGLRQHSMNSSFTNYPYGNGDLSYGLVYEVKDIGGYWQFGLNYTPDTSATAEDGSNIGSIWTPQANLLFGESKWHFGAGILRDYINSDTGSNWSDVYWQVIGGLGLPPFGKLNIRLQTMYVFDKWDRIDDFDAGDLEYGVWVTYYF